MSGFDRGARGVLIVLCCKSIRACVQARVCSVIAETYPLNPQRCSDRRCDRGCHILDKTNRVGT